MSRSSDAPVASTSALPAAPTMDRTSARKEARPKGYMHFVAGGLGGMCGAIVTSPLDVVKTRLQSDMYKDRPTWARAGASSSRATVGEGSLRRIARYTRSLAYHFVETGQLLREISIREGPKALYRGLGPTLVGVIPARSINFYTYGNGKVFIAEHFYNGVESPSVHLYAAAFAGLVTATATNPIWVVKTRLQLQQHEARRAEVAVSKAAAGSQSSLHSASKHQARTLMTSASAKQVHASFSTQAASAARSTALGGVTGEASRTFFRSKPRPLRPGLNSLQMTIEIVRAEGIQGLYKGLSASYLGATEGTIQWVLYEQLKRIDLQSFSSGPRTASSSSGERKSGLASTVGAAGVAKMVASLLTYPHEVLRTRLRQQPLPGEPRKYRGLMQTAKVVLREEGVASFYGGLSAHLLRVVPNAAIMFVVYETMLSLSK